MFDYDAGEVREFEPETAEACAPHRESRTVSWINLDGIHDPARQGEHQTEGPDYLVYRLIDIIVDNYLIVTDSVAEMVEDLEEDILDRYDEASRRRIQRLKKDLLFLRKSVTPVRDAVGNLEKGLSPLVHKKPLTISGMFTTTSFRSWRLWIPSGTSVLD